MPEYELINHTEGNFIRPFVVSINQRLFHWHNDLELLLVLDGSVTVDMVAGKYALSRDDLFLINPKDIHGIRKVAGNNVLLALQIDPRFALPWFPEMKSLRFLDNHLSARVPLDLNPIRRLMIDLTMAGISKGDGHQLRQMALLNELLYQLYRLVPHALVNENRIRIEHDNRERLSRILDYIQTNFRQSIGLDELSAHVSLEKTYLSRYIKKQLGISFQQYLTLVRVNKAVELLIQSELRMIDICLECGFSDYRYFNQAFIQEFGCSPSQFRMSAGQSHHPHGEIVDPSQHTLMNEADIQQVLGSYLQTHPDWSASWS